jgi:hypothetical protein
LKCLDSFQFQKRKLEYIGKYIENGKTEEINGKGDSFLQHCVSWDIIEIPCLKINFDNVLTIRENK